MERAGYHAHLRLQNVRCAGVSKREDRMRFDPGNLMAALTMAAALLIAGVSTAQAIDLRAPGERERLLRQGIDLQALESRQRRQDFQNLQQRYRDEDRMRRVQPPVELSKPRFRTNCQNGISGNSYLSNCR
jgi:hypothetical protein